jgi:GNAT superfamily N-acetyltransferase
MALRRRSRGGCLRRQFVYALGKRGGHMMTQFESRIPDMDDFWRLFATTGWNDEYGLSPAELHVAVSRCWFAVSAWQADRLVGFGRVVSDGVLHAMIYELIVVPDCQGQGIGAEILAQLVARCHEAGVRDIQLFSARGKCGFYERRKFRARPHDAPGMEYVGER